MHVTHRHEPREKNETWTRCQDMKVTYSIAVRKFVSAACHFLVCTTVHCYESHFIDIGRKWYKRIDFQSRWQKITFLLFLTPRLGDKKQANNKSLQEKSRMIPSKLICFIRLSICIGRIYGSNRSEENVMLRKRATAEACTREWETHTAPTIATQECLLPNLVLTCKKKNKHEFNK